ncbi:hypothetical protein D3C80_1436600 [compost metagenome]
MLRMDFDALAQHIRQAHALAGDGRRGGGEPAQQLLGRGARDHMPWRVADLAQQLGDLLAAVGQRCQDPGVHARVGRAECIEQARTQGAAWKHGLAGSIREAEGACRYGLHSALSERAQWGMAEIRIHGNGKWGADERDGTLHGEGVKWDVP